MKSLLFLALLTVVILGVSSNECLTDRYQPIHIPAFLLTEIHLDSSSDVTLTWQAARGTTNVTIWATDDVILDTDDVTDGYLNIEAESKIKPTIKPKVSESRSGSDTNSRLFSGMLLFSSTLLCLIIDGQKKWSAIMVLILASLFTLSSCQNSTTCDEGPAIHIQIPTNMVDQMCVNSVCRPLICKLSRTSEYSDIPSNNRIIFSDDQCTIKQPDFWDEWLVHYFGNGTTQNYHGDFDGDGLVNVLEYHGPEAYEGNFVTIDNSLTVENRTLSGSGTDSGIGGSSGGTTTGNTVTETTFEAVLSRGTNPLKFDSDGDLIPDGRERYYETDPGKPDPIDTDDDNDGLNTLDEQIHNTDPMNGDSDGDGTKDGEEVEQGSDPRDATDQGKPDECKQTAKINITIGDHSGSKSERYWFRLGDKGHQSPSHGVIGSGVYVYQIGTYEGTIEHSGTNRRTKIPDYDYTALLEKVDGKAKVTISDPSGMLGVHADTTLTTPLYSEGKSVIVKVELDCETDPANPCCGCGQFSRCEACHSSTDPDCVWDVDKKTCKPKLLWSPKVSCPCTQCTEWYNRERADDAWRDTLNTALPCPCSVQMGDKEVTPINKGLSSSWTLDDACSAQGKPFCSEYHPGAYGCIRSTDAVGIGAARQQCCYDNTGAIIKSGPGAGTPDRDRRLWNLGHYQADVQPYEWCCKECEVPSESCPKYSGPDGVRTGDFSHCP